jgi:hypothetical protein
MLPAQEADKVVKSLDNIKPITIFAIITIGCIVFMGWLTTGKMDKVDATTIETRQELKLHHDHAEILHGNFEYYLKKQTAVLQAICLDNATTPEARSACIKE